MTVTLIKFMKEEELIEMMKDIKNFRYNGHALRGNCKYDEPNWVTRAKHNLNIKRIDYIDVLLVGEGYVRIDTQKDSIVYDLFRRLYRFDEEL